MPHDRHAGKDCHAPDDGKDTPPPLTLYLPPPPEPPGPADRIASLRRRLAGVVGTAAAEAAVDELLALAERLLAVECEVHHLRDEVRTLRREVGR